MDGADSVRRVDCAGPDGPPRRHGPGAHRDVLGRAAARPRRRPPRRRPRRGVPPVVRGASGAASLPEVLERVQTTPVGTTTGAERLRWRIADLLAHSWDLAQATGVPADVPDDLAERSLSFTRAQLPSQRRGGRFAEPRPVAPGASPLDRLAAFTEPHGPVAGHPFGLADRHRSNFRHFAFSQRPDLRFSGFTRADERGELEIVRPSNYCSTCISRTQVRGDVMTIAPLRPGTPAPPVQTLPPGSWHGRLWVSDLPLTRPERYLGCVAEFERSGLWPVLIPMTSASRRTARTGSTTAAAWPRRATGWLRPTWRLPFPLVGRLLLRRRVPPPVRRAVPGPGEAQPPPVGPVGGGGQHRLDPLDRAPHRLGLVQTERPADIPALLGWTGMIKCTDQVAELSAVLRSWEDRFGATLVVLGFDTLELSVSAPPRNQARALTVAAEHRRSACRRSRASREICGSTRRGWCSRGFGGSPGHRSPAPPAGQRTTSPPKTRKK